MFFWPSELFYGLYHSWKYHFNFHYIISNYNIVAYNVITQLIKLPLRKETNSDYIFMFDLEKVDRKKMKKILRNLYTLLRKYNYYLIY